MKTISPNFEASIGRRTATVATALLATAALTACGPETSHQLKDRLIPHTALTKEGDPPTVVCRKPVSGSIVRLIQENETGKYIYRHLRSDMHFNRYGTAAVMGEMYSESAMQADYLGAAGGYGLLQWSVPYWSGITFKYAHDGVDPHTASGQAKMFELDIAEKPDVLRTLRTASSSDEAIRSLNAGYLKDARLCLDFRESYADAVDQAFGQ